MDGRTGLCEDDALIGLTDKRLFYHGTSERKKQRAHFYVEWLNVKLLTSGRFRIINPRETIRPPEVI